VDGLDSGSIAELPNVDLGIIAVWHLHEVNLILP
jgi:hypothetical protein